MLKHHPSKHNARRPSMCVAADVAADVARCSSDWCAVGCGAGGVVSEIYKFDITSKVVAEHLELDMGEPTLISAMQREG